MNRAAWWVGVGLMLASGSGCRPTGENVRNLVLDGSNPMTPLVREMGRRFEADHPGVRIDVQNGGSDRGLDDTRKGLADVGMVARALRPEEVGLYATVIARDGLALLVHKDNPVASLTDEQVTRVFNRAITNWKQLGGKDAPITLVSRPDGTAALTVFLDHFKLKPTQVRADQVAATAEQAVRAVAAYPRAVAIVSIGPAEAAIKDGAAVRLLPLGGVAATLANVRNGTYPLIRPLILVTREAPKGLPQEFIDFARSSAVRDLVEKYHFVPPTP